MYFFFQKSYLDIYIFLYLVVKIFYRKLTFKNIFIENQYSNVFWRYDMCYCN